LHLSFFFFLSRVLITASCSTTKRPSSLQHKTTYASQSQSFPPPLSLFLSSTSLVSLSWTTLAGTKTPPRSNRTLSPYLTLVLPLCTYTYTIQPHHQHPRGCRYYTKLDLANEAPYMYIRQPSCSLRRASANHSRIKQAFLSLFSFHFHSSACLPSQLSFGGTAVHTISAGLLHMPLFLVDTPWLSPSPSLSFFLFPSTAWTTYSPLQRPP